MLGRHASHAASYLALSGRCLFARRIERSSCALKPACAAWVPACRRDSLYVPWKCEHERHEYELCQYKDYKRRMALAAAEQGA